MGCLKLHTENNYTPLKVVYSAENTSVLAEWEGKTNAPFLQLVYKEAQSGGGLFANETDAYKAMWLNSFDSQGNPYRESGAWLTNKGVLVLPQIRNASVNSYFDYYPVSKVKADGYRYVLYKNLSLQILGAVHTHPNGFNIAPSDPSDYPMVNYLRGLPIFVISPSSVYMGQIFNGVNKPIYMGTRENLLNGNMSLYGW